MLKYFSKKDNLSDVIKYINTDRPKIVISEYNCLIDNRLFKRDDDEISIVKILEDFINDVKTIQFKIIDNKFLLNDIIDGLKVNKFYDMILSQEELVIPFLNNYSNVISATDNIWSVNLDDYKKNNLLKMYISEQTFENMEIYLLFSTLTDAISFLLVHDISDLVKVVVFDIQSQYNNELKNKFLSLLND